MATTTKGNNNPSQKTTTTRPCLCSPTNHPGSFRCHLHRNPHSHSGKKKRVSVSAEQYWELANMAKANSLKAFLLQMIKPSCHDLQRKRNFQPKPSRFYLLDCHSTDHHRVEVS